MSRRGEISKIHKPPVYNLGLVRLKFQSPETTRIKPKVGTGEILKIPSRPYIPKLCTGEISKIQKLPV